MKKLIGITVFLFIVYGGLLASHRNAASLDTHFLLGQRIGLYGILSLAAGLLIVTGGIDLSIGSLVCLASTAFGMLIVGLQQGMSLWIPISLRTTRPHVVFWEIPIAPCSFATAMAAAVLTMLVLGLLAGILHGLLVTRIGLQPFMVTLCGLFIYRSAARWLTKDTKIEALESNLHGVPEFFNGAVLGLPVYLVILLSLVALAAVFLHLSVYGRYFYALGSNEKAARFSGISVNLHKVLAYVLCSVLTALYSFLAVMNTPSVAPSSTGQNDELMAIAGAVLGGCTLRGGEGTVYGMVVGTMIIQILRMMNTFWGIPSAAEGMMIGFILLLGIILDETLRRRERAKAV